jgi:hypothetical protein
MVEKRNEAAAADTRKLQEREEADTKRRAQDSNGTTEPDPREDTEAPQPFSGSEH